MNPDATGRTQLTHSLADESHPSWSPDGTELAYTGESFTIDDRSVRVSCSAAKESLLALTAKRGQGAKHRQKAEILHGAADRLPDELFSLAFGL